ncbi:UMP kinase [Fusibacter ferrireducens]|uniref:Uridylate kinase n=1 Tax=Fusibacter ferrireducens TaxID=2785058 RepID=A0ABR9ZQ47_9FIRM|nr:UMP kinase [Fusibacter ferrireducens]MBF4691759.1 UMP kinase [Fusibacter ferrireducens]
MELKYKRVLLKLSGEVLAGTRGSGVDYDTVHNIAKYVKEIHQLGAEVGIVIGAGNFWRGRSNPKMERTTADYMGMLATVMNSLAMSDALKYLDVESKVLSAIPMPQVGEAYNRENAVHYLSEGKVVLFAAGTGSPFFSTDTAAALRAAEIDAELILLAKNIDGVYDCDPVKYESAKKYDKISFTEVLNQKLGVMDLTSITICMDNHIPISVFDLNFPENIIKACSGLNVGTIIEEA